MVPDVFEGEWRGCSFDDDQQEVGAFPFPFQSGKSDANSVEISHGGGRIVMIKIHLVDERNNGFDRDTIFGGNMEFCAFGSLYAYVRDQCFDVLFLGAPDLKEAQEFITDRRWTLLPTEGGRLKTHEQFYMHDFGILL